MRLTALLFILILAIGLSSVTFGAETKDLKIGKIHINTHVYIRPDLSTTTHWQVSGCSDIAYAFFPKTETQWLSLVMAQWAAGKKVSFIGTCQQGGYLSVTEVHAYPN